MVEEDRLDFDCDLGDPVRVGAAQMDSLVGAAVASDGESNVSFLAGGVSAEVGKGCLHIDEAVSLTSMSV